MMWYFTDGRSRTAPPRTRTTECSWRLWPIPGMYAVTSMPFESRTRAILRSAEFGFFGVMVRTTVQTPRFWGAPFGRTECRPLSEFHVRRRAGVSTFLRWGFRPFRISCEVVGTGHSFYYHSARAKTRTCGHASLTSPPGSGTPAEASAPGVARPHSQDRERADTRNEGPGGAFTARKSADREVCRTDGKRSIKSGSGHPGRHPCWAGYRAPEAAAVFKSAPGRPPLSVTVDAPQKPGREPAAVGDH